MYMKEFRKVKCPKCGRIKMTKSETHIKCDICNFSSSIKNFQETTESCLGVNNE